ncbi:unnamed protein product [Clonostachys solani]|uniref:Uncharacterized protein n=1 Tax=Clonostachys solani TaxID=160281 RepID=A0A9N9YZ25_9HYPO|nr:unnamed protein product [Clonostachys solani]
MDSPTDFSIVSHNAGLEPGCFAITFERKYYQRGNSIVKRSLRPHEFHHGAHRPYVPRLRYETLMNEAACLRFIRNYTNIPVPEVYCDFEDDGAYYLVTEYIHGVRMADLQTHEEFIVSRELGHHLATLKTLTSNRLGGPSSIVIPPRRVMRHTNIHHWSLMASDQEEYVFCHNDLTQSNVIVDPETLAIKAIID